MTSFIEKIRAMSTSKDKHTPSAHGGILTGHSHLNPEHTDERQGQSVPYVASGRGGAGNFTKNKSKAPPAIEVPDAAEAAIIAKSHQHPHAAGRGGAGNYTTDHDDAEKRRQLEQDEAEVRRAYEAKHEADHATSGRGGVGNLEHQHPAS